MPDYFERLQREFERTYSIAQTARKANFDPSPEVEIIPAEDVAARVEGIVGPPGVSAEIRALDTQKSREFIAYEVLKSILQGKYGKKDREALIDQAVRTGVAILTEGVLVAPTEGIARIKINKNQDGSEYLSVYFAGPIRSAGGTIAALSVVLADIARIHMGISSYRPTDTAVERYVEEIYLYDARGARLQYKPTEDEIRQIVRNCPVCVDGDPTEEFEVSVYKDVPGVETNRVRGGIALVIGEGIAQKASKVLKYTKKVGLSWDWLETIVKIPKKEGDSEIKPNAKFLDDIVAGRPIFCYPSAKGGFRLRYGRSRMTGIAAKAIHPATMHILDSFTAIGTQMRVERPGKGCVVSPCDSIDGPVVRLVDGSVRRLSSGEEAKKVLGEIEEILSLGDILVSYGDFRKSNHPLMPSAWCEEWWCLELSKAGGGKVNHEKLGAEEAFRISEKHGVPLHPKFTYMWHDISSEQLGELARWIVGGKLVKEWFRLKEMQIEASPVKRVLEELCVPHSVREKYVVLDSEHAYSLLRCLGAFGSKGISLDNFNKVYAKEKTALQIVNELAGVKVMKKAPTYIGARMGRPEKAKERLMKPAPNVLFPVGETGGKIRSIIKAYRVAKERADAGVSTDVVRLKCPSCGKITMLNKCPNCGVRTSPERTCIKCGRVGTKEECPCGSITSPYDTRNIDVAGLLDAATKRCGGHMPEDIKGVRGMTSKSKIPEPLEKGILRAKHGVFVFKDGTARFDATDMVLTHFSPAEVGVSVEKLRGLGYVKDCKGNELKSPDQLLELRVQDLLVSDHGGDYLMNVANFIDDLLVYLYGLPPFYNLKSREDLVGQLIVGLSPHTSCGVLGRVVGFTKARVGYAHPYFHSAKRRNCDGDEDSIMMLMDALLNFSREFLPESRGSTMDASIVLSTSINPKEIDDEVHAMEVCPEYPLELYHKSLELANPGDIKLERVSDRLGKKEQYEGIWFTHDSSSIDDAPIKTRYVEFKSMRDKVDAQFGLTSKIRAVDNKDAAERVILSHFLPDLYGNLRAFSRQGFRCGSCNAKYRRVPLIGKCTRCGEKLLLTVNKGGIEKYLKISQEIAERYDLPAYLKQRLALIETEIGSVFEDETSKQFNLAEFM